MRYFANPAKNRNPATFWPEPDL